MVLLLVLACARSAPPAEESPPADDSGPVVDTDESGTPGETGDSATETGTTGETGETDPPPSPTEAAAQAMVDAALAFWASLDADQQAAVGFAFDDPERYDWSNLPVPNYPRQGLERGDLTPEQVALADALLAASLSEQGRAKAEGIILVDELLFQGGDAIMGERFYTYALFGTPSMDTPWGWQLDGHHLAMNFTAWGEDVVMVPTLKGLAPTVWGEGTHAGLRPLGPEEDLAWTFIGLLDAEQLDLAVIADRVPSDILAGPSNDEGFPSHEGLPASALTAAQREALLDLVAAYVLDQEDAFGAIRLADLEAGLDDVWVAWMGDTTWGGRMYYRIHGPTLIVEFDHVNGGDHIHAVYRDPVDDYGEGILAAHYARYPHDP